MSEAERISGCPPGPKSLTEKPAKIKRTFRANFSNWVSLSPPAANRKRMQTYPSQHVSSFQPRPPGMIILTFIFSFIPYQKKQSVRMVRTFSTLAQRSSLPCSCWHLWGFDCSNCYYCWKKNYIFTGICNNWYNVVVLIIIFARGCNSR